DQPAVHDEKQRDLTGGVRLVLSHVLKEVLMDREVLSGCAEGAVCYQAELQRIPRLERVRRTVKALDRRCGDGVGDRGRRGAAVEPVRGKTGMVRLEELAD